MTPFSQIDRRAFVAGLGLAVPAAALALPAAAGAATPDLTPLPEALDAADCPGLSWIGAGPSAIEVFDYNCPYCRAVFAALDAKVSQKALRLGLIDSPQLSIGSIQAAKARQAVFRLHGARKAYEFHRRLYAQRGPIDGERALAAARELHFDIAALTDAADDDETRAILVGQAKFLDRAGARTTPSFLIGRNLMSGWPGVEGFEAALKGAA